jgi:hypothetical protein
MGPSVQEAQEPVAWVQCLNAEGMAYFLNLQTGVAQWEAPQELLDFWEREATRRPQVTVKEVSGEAVVSRRCQSGVGRPRC